MLVEHVRYHQQMATNYPCTCNTCLLYYHQKVKKYYFVHVKVSVITNNRLMILLIKLVRINIINKKVKDYAFKAA